MKKLKVGDLYYYKNSKSIVEILNNTIKDSKILVKIVFTDGIIKSVGWVGVCDPNLLWEKVEKKIILSL